MVSDCDTCPLEVQVDGHVLYVGKVLVVTLYFVGFFANIGCTRSVVVSKIG